MALKAVWDGQSLAEVCRQQKKWKNEAQNNPSQYSEENLERMAKSKPPIGSDGYPMELHHVDRTSSGGMDAMTRTEHRLGENFKKNHP